MRNPEDDVALADGHAFMVTDAPYKEHLKTAAEFKEAGCYSFGLHQTSLITAALGAEEHLSRASRRLDRDYGAGKIRGHGHRRRRVFTARVLRPSCMRRFPAGRTVSDMYGTTVLRRLVIPICRQRNMDYVLHWILMWLNGLTQILVLYDIMCQYFTHLRERFAKSPHLTMPTGLKIQQGIGQFHVHGHIAQCFA